MSIECKVCGEKTIYVKNLPFLLNHIGKIHKMTNQEYYDCYFKKEKEGVCESCGKETKFIKFSNGYRRYCSQKCSTNSPSTHKKTKQTFLQKTGFEHNMKNPEHIEKRKKSNLEKYGVEWTIQDKDVVKKIKNTIKEKYGVDNFNNREKSKLTCIEKYGVDNVSKAFHIKERLKVISKENSEETLRKSKITNLERYGVDSPYKLEKTKNNKRLTIIESLVNFFKNNCVGYTLVKHNLDGSVVIVCPHGHEFEIQLQYLHIRLKRNEVLCKVCNPVKTGNFSHKEKELLQFITDNYNGKIISNDRTAIKPLELDIYLPELNLAFEYNGLFWHNELNKPNNYHKEKTEMCEKNEIHLIQIWEDDWEYKQEIIKSRIFNLLGKSTVIYARKCTIQKGISYRSFLDKNHIQGYVPSQYSIGLFYENELVSLMTFGKARFYNKGYELLRFCNKIGYSVVGGADKLFKHFIKENKPSSVISYASREWSKGNLYEKLGFKFESITQPNYYYIVDGLKKNRFKYRKSELIKQGFDKNLSEHDIMLKRGLYRIYDTGQLKYIYKYL